MNFYRICFLLISFAFWAGRSNAQCTTTDFEAVPGTSIANSSSIIPDPLIIDGWQWDSPQASEVIIAGPHPAFGGTVNWLPSSGDFAYINSGSSLPINIKLQDFATCSVESVSMNAAQNIGLEVLIEGMRNGAVVSTSNAILDGSTPISLVPLNFIDIDAIRISLVTLGATLPGQAGFPIIVMDDFTFCDCCPLITASPTIDVAEENCTTGTIVYGTCPDLTIIEYSLDGMTWDDTPIDYDPDDAIDVYARCSCNDTSGPSNMVTTNPQKCVPIPTMGEWGLLCLGLLLLIVGVVSIKSREVVLR